MSRVERSGGRDDGSVLILVLVMMLIGSLIVLPILTYSMSVFRAQRVQGSKQRSVQLAQGGTWIALSNEDDLWDLCDGSTLPSSLSGVTTECQVLENVTQYDPADVPFPLAVVQADATLPGSLATTPAAYSNPNSAASDPDDADAWLDTPDWSSSPESGKVWLPKLPVRNLTESGARDRTMPPGTQEPGYTSCRVFFPGTFTSPIDVAEPAYFVSGVYYFTAPITIRPGADVVAGSGAAGGCTTDFEAIGNVTPQPVPINFSGVGATFVLGNAARIVVDGSTPGDIRFEMNQRYVEEGDATVAASKGVSIVSVNGTHAPLVVPEAPGDDLAVAGVIGVPASVVGTDGDPAAIDQGYAPSTLTPKPTEPGSPTNVAATPNRTGTGGTAAAATVRWDAPNANGALITGYVVTSSPGLKTCSPPAPTLPDTEVATGCTVTGLTSNTNYTFTVVATNAAGASAPSAPSAVVRPRSSGGSASPLLAAPSAPSQPALGATFSDGLEVTWDPPASDGGSPVTGYRVRATDVVTSATVTCDAWWNETSCVLPAAGGLAPAVPYAIEIHAVNQYGDPPVVYPSVPAVVDGDPTDDLVPPPNPEPDPVVWVPGATPAPVQQPTPAAVRVPDPIIDLRMTTGAVKVSIGGYVAVPQGHIRIDAADPSGKTVRMLGGVVAGRIRMDAGREPAGLVMTFDNPIGQKRIRLRSVTTDGYAAVSDAVVQINRSGSLSINSWYKQ